MRTLLLAAAGTLALSTAAFADVATYTIENGIYTFTSSGTCPVDLRNSAVKGVVLSENVQLEYSGMFALAGGATTLTLNSGSKLSGPIVTLTSATVVDGSSRIEAVTGFVSLGVLTLNADLTLKMQRSISLPNAFVSMNLDNAGSLTGAFLTLDTPTVTEPETTSFNLQFSGVLTGDYKLVALHNEAINTETNRDAILAGKFKLNNTAMTDTEKANLRWDGNTLVYSAGAVPEPSLFGVLAGLGALALAGTRRRRK